MDKGLTAKRIPTVFALFILVGILGLTVNLTNQRGIFVGRADTKISPKNVKITNTTDNSFNISFTTEEKAKSLIIINNEQTSLILDDRDKSKGIQSAYSSHYITVSNLNPNTNYKYKILIDDKEFESNTYTAKTGPKIESSPYQNKEISGQVNLPDGSKASESIITISFPDSQLLSSLTDEEGKFKFTTDALRNKDLTKYILINNSDIANIDAYQGEHNSSIKASFENTFTLPTIVLSEKYEFLGVGEKSATKSSDINKNTTQPIDIFPTLTTLNQQADNTADKTDDNKIIPPNSANELNSINRSEKPSPTPIKNILKTSNIKNEELEKTAMTGISLSIVLIGVLLLAAL